MGKRSRKANREHRLMERFEHDAKGHPTPKRARPTPAITLTVDAVPKERQRAYLVGDAQSHQERMIRKAQAEVARRTRIEQRRRDDIEIARRLKESQ